MKKRFLLILSVLVIVFGFCFANSKVVNVKADPGFDSSWDSGSSSSWDSGSSSSWDSDYSGSGSGGIDLFTFFGIIIIIAIIIVVSSKNNKNKIYSQISSLIPLSLSEDDIKKILGDDFDINKFNQDVFDIYNKVCIAWSNNDIEPIRGLLSDEMYNMYRTQIMTMTTKNERNVMEDISLVNSYISSINKGTDYIEIYSVLEVTCKDYMINTSNNNVTRGNKNIVNDYIYEITLRCDLIDNKNDSCPNCGAKLDDKNVTNCPYCRSLIVKPSGNYVMTQKKMLKQGRK